eukprot:6145383-Amphidinium_carterae.1
MSWKNYSTLSSLWTRTSMTPGQLRCLGWQPSTAHRRHCFEVESAFEVEEEISTDIARAESAFVSKESVMPFLSEAGVSVHEDMMPIEQNMEDADTRRKKSPHLRTVTSLEGGLGLIFRAFIMIFVLKPGVQSFTHQHNSSAQTHINKVDSRTLRFMGQSKMSCKFWRRPALRHRRCSLNGARWDPTWGIFEWKSECCLVVWEAVLDGLAETGRVYGVLARRREPLHDFAIKVMRERHLVHTHTHTHNPIERGCGVCQLDVLVVEHMG